MSQPTLNKENSSQIIPRKAPQQARAIATVTRILDGARTLLREQGADAVTTRNIAQASGIRPGSIYQYFPNKESILFALYGNRMEETVDALNKLMTEENLLLTLEEFWVKFENILQTELKWGQPEDVQLDKAMGENPALIEANATVLNKLYHTVASLLKAYGSRWPDKKLLELAEFTYRLNHFGFTMRIRQDLKKQQSTREFTRNAQIHLLKSALT